MDFRLSVLLLLQVNAVLGDAGLATSGSPSNDFDGQNVAQGSTALGLRTSASRGRSPRSQGSLALRHGISTGMSNGNGGGSSGTASASLPFGNFLSMGSQLLGRGLFTPQISANVESPNLPKVNTNDRNFGFSYNANSGSKNAPSTLDGRSRNAAGRRKLKSKLTVADEDSDDDSSDDVTSKKRTFVSKAGKGDPRKSISHYEEDAPRKLRLKCDHPGTGEDLSRSKLDEDLHYQVAGSRRKSRRREEDVSEQEEVSSRLRGPDISLEKTRRKTLKSKCKEEADDDEMFGMTMTSRRRPQKDDGARRRKLGVQYPSGKPQMGFSAALPSLI